MSEENRDEATGQFSSAEPLFGIAAEEHEAGYVPYKEEAAPEEAGELTAREAADEIINSTTPDSKIKTYSAIDLPENVSLTIEQAAKIKTDMDAADEAQAALEAADALRKEVDELRGEKREFEAAKEAKTEATPSDPNADVEKFLAIPHVKEAVDKWNSEAETARQQYTAGLQAATQIAQAAFISQFPEFANIPEEQRGQALLTMQQQDPDRYNRIASAVTNAAQLFEQQKAAHHWQQQQDAADFQSYAKAEDARFSELVKGETPAQMRKIEAHIPKMLSELGVDPGEFLKAGNDSKFLRSAAAQAILVKAANYDLIKSAPKPVAARAPLPPVQRPGVARSAGERSGDSLQALEAKLTKTGDIKDATALYMAKYGRR